MPTAPRAALYLRISKADNGDESGIARQRADCLRLAEADGLDLVAEYADNDTSAYSRKPRPQFEAMLRAAQADEFDVILVWATDRLYRRLADLERIVGDLDGVEVRAVKSGRIDLSTADGRLHARMLGSVAQHESEKKAERVAARARQRAEAGTMTASIRPFGWTWADPDPADPARPRPGSRAGLVPHPTEAPAVREVYQLVADGGSVRSAARWLRHAGLVGTTGRPFTPETTRSILTNPRNAGRIAYRGEVVAGVVGTSALVHPDLFDAVAARLSDPARRTAPGRPAGSPLSGLAVCGKCGGPMNASNKHDRSGKRPVYVCSRAQHLTRRRDLVDDPVLALIGAWLTRNADRIAAAARPTAGTRETTLARRADELQRRLDVLAALVADGTMDPADYAAAARETRARLDEARRQSAAVRTRPATARLVGSGDVARAWHDLTAGDVEALRAVLAEVLDTVVVNPAARRGHPTPADLEVRWAGWLTGISAEPAA